MASKSSIIAAYNYMIIRLAIRYIENDRKLYSQETLSYKDLVARFNSKNDFTFKKMALFPFLVSVANGYKSKEIMLDFFNYQNSFVAKPYGVVQTDIEDYLRRLFQGVETDNFLFFNKLYEIVEEPEQSNSVINIKLLGDSELESCSVDNSDLLKTKVREQLIGEEESSEIDSVFKRIDHCVKFLHDNRFERFVNSDVSFIESISRSSSSYRMYLNLIDNYGGNKPIYQAFFANSLKGEYFVVT